jgi:hypothetical protein
MSPDFIARLERYKPARRTKLNRICVRPAEHLPAALRFDRYYGVNFHNVWYRGTVEFRWFEGTLHAGKVKSYVQFVLALAAKGLTSARGGRAGSASSGRSSAKYTSGSSCCTSASSGRVQDGTQTSAERDAGRRCLQTGSRSRSRRRARRQLRP